MSDTPYVDPGDAPGTDATPTAASGQPDVTENPHPGVDPNAGTVTPGVDPEVDPTSVNEAGQPT